MKRSYEEAAHAMQAGVAFEMQMDPDHAATSPKHLRVVVNSALVDSSALAKLLIAKGIFTYPEYYEALAEGMEAEVDRYTQRLERLTGKKVTLV